MAKPLTPKTIDSLVNRAFAIENEQAQEAGSLGFMARAMVQATLPHRKVNGTLFKRVNGNFTLSIGQADPDIGLPYGMIPRLLLAWATTEAVRTKNRELELGTSMSAFMEALDISRQGSSIASLKNQTRRLFSATIRASYKDEQGVVDIGYLMADKTVLWWQPKDSEQSDIWRSTITLSETFFNEVVDRPVPIDMRTIRAIEQSSLALDIYTWLTYRAQL